MLSLLLCSQSGKRKGSTENVSTTSKKSKDTVIVDIEINISVFLPQFFGSFLK
jgi:hypothetical protein